MGRKKLDKLGPCAIVLGECEYFFVFLMRALDRFLISPFSHVKKCVDLSNARAYVRIWNLERITRVESGLRHP